MQNIRRSILILLFFLTTHASVGHCYEPKEGNINATFGPFIYKANTGSSFRAPWMVGEGLIANGDINPHGALEVDFFHLNKTFALTQGGYSLVESRETLVVGMGYRYWLNSWLSGTLTFYSSYGMGDSQTVHDDFPAVEPMQTSAHATTLYGFEGALRAEVWSWDRFGIDVDTRYSLATSHKSGEKSDDYGVLIGLRYLVQEKQIRPPPP